MEKRKKHIIHIVTSTSILVILVLLLIMSFKTAKTTQGVTDNAIDQLSHFYIQEIAKNRATLISDELEKKYQNMNNALSIITQEDLESTESLRAYLGNIRSLFGVDTFALVDENGLVYTSYSTLSGKTDILSLQKKSQNQFIQQF